jgi:hypothetical protein
MNRILTRRPGPVVAAQPAPAPLQPSPTAKGADWRNTENLPLTEASRISGVSVTSLYRARAEGKLRFRRLAGRVVTTTESFAAFVDGADEWTPSTKGKEARAARRAVELGQEAA